jgi:hypothetical protein
MAIESIAIADRLGRSGSALAWKIDSDDRLRSIDHAPRDRSEANPEVDLLHVPRKRLSAKLLKAIMLPSVTYWKCEDSETQWNPVVA